MNLFKKCIVLFLIPILYLSSAHAIVWLGPASKVKKHGDIATHPKFGGTVELSNGYSKFCTGSIVRAKWVLSARHCIANTSHIEYRGRQYKVIKKLALKNDITLLKVNTPFPANAKKLKFLPGRLSKGKVFSQAGYGTFGNLKNPNPGHPPRLLAGTNRIIDIANGFYSYHMTRDRATASEAGTAPGDSGGPGITRVKGAFYHIGVTSYGFTLYDGYLARVNGDVGRMLTKKMNTN